MLARGRRSGCDEMVVVSGARVYRTADHGSNPTVLFVSCCDGRVKLQRVYDDARPGRQRHECNAKCLASTGPACECKCRGVNHGLATDPEGRPSELGGSCGAAGSVALGGASARIGSGSYDRDAGTSGLPGEQRGEDLERDRGDDLAPGAVPSCLGGRRPRRRQLADFGARQRRGQLADFALWRGHLAELVLDLGRRGLRPARGRAV